jgi:hypothetical protein
MADSSNIIDRISVWVNTTDGYSFNIELNVPHIPEYSWKDVIKDIRNFFKTNEIKIKEED